MNADGADEGENENLGMINGKRNSSIGGMGDGNVGLDMLDFATSGMSTGDDSPETITVPTRNDMLSFPLSLDVPLPPIVSAP